MSILIDTAALKPLVALVVEETVDRLAAAHDHVPDARLAYPESEAAALLGIAPHALRDSRLRGELVGAKVGKKILYERDELISFLARRRQ